jgi:Na+/H+-dicarboxylate symporter
MKKINLGLLPRLLLGILAGILIGSLGGWFGISDSPVFSFVIRLCATFTGLFSVFLKFIIPLLILSFVSVSLAELGRKANKLFLITLGLAYLSTIFAGIFAYSIGSFSLPHLISTIDSIEFAGNTYDAFFTIEVDPVFGIMTALILSFVLGIGMANIKSTKLYDVLKDIQDIVAMTLTKVIIPVIPYYIAAQFATIAATGELLETIKMFAILFGLILCLQYVFLGVEFGVSSIWCKKNQYKKLRNILPAYFTALGTQSSAATIPVNLESAYKNGISEDVANFCIPLCATIHLAGDTICLVLGTMGIMLASGASPTLGAFIPFIMMLGITMIAAPGVPGGGVMAALGIITSMFGFTDLMQSLIISLHFSQDSFGTAANITGDQALALIVDHIDQKSGERHKAVEDDFVEEMENAE